MAVMAREAWTDHRLDDLNARVESIDRRMESGFKEMREEFRAVRMEMAAQTALLNQTIYRLFGGMLVAWIVGIIAILVQT
ncbi:MAG TPA: hypothetical protein VF030_10720 [Solirubrobacterales bacterium]